MAKVTNRPVSKRAARKTGVFTVYRGVALPSTEISRAARTRELYEAMKAEREEVGA